LSDEGRTQEERERGKNEGERRRKEEIEMTTKDNKT
jgi:hypothetical protein